MPITKKPKGKPDDVLVCWQSFVKETPNGYISYQRGDRVRREEISKEVTNYVDFFKLDGTKDPIQPVAPPPEYDDPFAAKIMEPLPDSETVTCVDGLVTAFEGRVVGIQSGERIRKDHSLVKLFPTRFKPTS